VTVLEMGGSPAKGRRGKGDDQPPGRARGVQTVCGSKIPRRRAPVRDAMEGKNGSGEAEPERDAVAPGPKDAASSPGFEARQVLFEFRCDLDAVSLRIRR
jgi:hypothetical protein